MIPLLTQGDFAAFCMLILLFTDKDFGKLPQDYFYFAIFCAWVANLFP